MTGLGGFGAFFDLKATGFKDPVLVGGTDGVGTKLKIAVSTGAHRSVGIDLVAMCVNDLVVQGAEPLFFLDYFATGKLDPETGRDIVSGIAEGCRQSGAALIGGETAEMPGMYDDGDYDLAGFCVGAVEREEILTGDAIAEGDAVLGLASSGPHANGYSLVRRIVALAGLSYQDPAPFDSGKPLGQALLEPTKIYVRSCLAAIKAGGVRGLAHVTGGGLIENIPRVLPNGLGCRLDARAWDIPMIFRWLARRGGIADHEMARTFNCGIGMAVIVDRDRKAELTRVFENEGETVWEIGAITRHDGSGERVAVSPLGIEP